MTDNLTTLLPCPFCGKTNTLEITKPNVKYATPDNYFLVCNANVGGCGASSGTQRTEAEAIAAWNTRHVETCENMREKFGYKRLFVCSECGVLFDPDCEINYCPSCGRKVVSA